MERQFLTTGDGAVTIHLPEWNEQYHSKHGAIQEAKHVFIATGLQYFIGLSPKNSISILEIGFGTGLNAFLTLLETKSRVLQISYEAVEAYPVALDEIEKLNYSELLQTSKTEFQKLHSLPWEEKLDLAENFELFKRRQFFADINDRNKFDIIYFDAFGARVQPELWTEDIFLKMYTALKKKGILVTYSAKGSVRRAMQSVGFNVERLPGPPGKREMLRASK